MVWLSDPLRGYWNSLISFFLIAEHADIMLGEHLISHSSVASKIFFLGIYVRLRGFRLMFRVYFVLSQSLLSASDSVHVSA